MISYKYIDADYLNVRVVQIDMKNKNQNLNEETKDKEILFSDLSASLDQSLLLIVSLLEGCDSEARINFYELAHVLSEYLGNRAALESVFFNRHLGTQRMNESKFKAELSRLKKLLKEGTLNVRS